MEECGWSFSAEECLDALLSAMEKAADEAEWEEQMRIYEATLKKTSLDGLVYIDGLLEVCKGIKSNNK